VPSLRSQVRALLPSLGDKANQLKDREAKERFYLLKAVAASNKPVKRVVEARGRSTDYFEKWAARLIEAGRVEGLLELSRRPRFSPNKAPEQLEKWAKRLKKKNPAYGPERISFYLRLRHGAECPPSTVYAILKRAGLINKKYRKSRSKAHTKRYRRPWPGWMQLDIKYVPYPILGKQLYQVSAIDHHSSWRFIRSFEDRTEQTIVGFLTELEAACPFAIFQIQTDNGTEFTDKYSSGRGISPSGSHAFDRWCEMHGIEHKLIPIGEKELNGKVENSHKYDDEEFYAFFRAQAPEELDAGVREHNRIWNSERHTKTLGWKTPDETVEWAQLVALAGLLALKNLDLEALLASQPKLETKSTPLGSVTAPAGSLRRRKPMAFVDRYLQYADWDEKTSRLKALLPLPPISQIFPKALAGYCNYQAILTAFNYRGKLTAPPLPRLRLTG
jgi:transposase InsO family protein